MEQLARTVDAMCVEIDRQNIRGLWSLLSDGIINVDTNIIDRSIEYIDCQLENSIEKFENSKKYVLNFEKNKYDY